MFNTFIDTVQGAKTQFLKTFVTNEPVRKSLQSFVDAQTTFAKQVAKTTQEVVTLTSQELVKADFAKAFASK